MKSKSDLGFRFFELKLAFYHSVLLSLNLWGKVRTMMTLGAKSASSESTKNTVGKALTLCALVFKTALHSSWICTKSIEDKDAERVKAFWAWGVLNRIWSGLGVRPGGWPSRLGVLLLFGRMAMRCLAAAWFKSASISFFSRLKIAMLLMIFSFGVKKSNDQFWKDTIKIITFRLLLEIKKFFTFHKNRCRI